MNVNRTKHYTEINGVDDNGEFKITVINDCSQIQMENFNSYSFIDTNLQKVKKIRDVLSEIINGFEKAESGQGF